MAQPQARAVAGHRTGACHGARRGVRRPLARAVHQLVRRFRAGRGARPDRCRGGSVAFQGNEHLLTFQEHSRRRVAHQRRLGHRGVPIRHRSRRHRHVLPRRRHSRLPVQLLRRYPHGHRPGLPGQLPCAQGSLVGPGEHDLPRVVRGVHAVHRVPCGQRAAHERHPGRGGGRSRERYLAARHRAVHLAHEHRLDKRLAGAVLRAQRRGVRVAGHAAAARLSRNMGKHGRFERQAHRVRAGSRLHRDLRAIRLGDGHGMGAQPRRTRRSPVRVGERAHGCRHDPGRPERSHHAGRGVHHILRGAAARPHDIHGLRRDRSNPASGHVRRAPAGTEEAAHRRGPALRRDRGEHRDTAHRHRGLGRAPDRREPCGHADGDPLLQRPHRAHQKPQRHRGRAEHGPAPAGGALGAGARAQAHRRRGDLPHHRLPVPQPPRPHREHAEASSRPLVGSELHAAPASHSALGMAPHRRRTARHQRHGTRAGHPRSADAMRRARG